MGTRLFVGGLTSRVRERDLEKFFGKYGRIKEIAMKNGFAFVDFDDYRDADDAMYELNGKDLLGERVSVERARGTPRGGDQWRGSSGGGRGGYGSSRGRSSRDNRESDMRSHSRYEGPPTRTEHRLIVENLSSRVSWQDLKDYMRQAGKVTYADAHKQRKNEGIVEFASYADLEKAIEELDDSELNGRRIRLVEDRRRSRGGGGGGGGGGRRSSRLSSSRSRSRSRSPRRSRRSRSGSRNKSRSKSRDRSSKSKSRSRSKSGSFPKEKNGTKRSRSRSVSKDRGGAASKSRSRSPAGDSPDKRD